MLGILCINGQFALVFASYIITSFGDWLNYVAAILLLEEITSSKKASFTSLFMILRLIPPILFAPIIGVISDSYDRRIVMALCSCLSAITVCGFIFIHSSSHLWLFFILVFLQQTFFAQYDPSRRALVTEVVEPGENLKAATTLDAFAWSLTLALGAASGGVIVAKFGKNVNFSTDAITYLLSAFIVMQIKRSNLKSSLHEKLHDDHNNIKESSFCQSFLEGSRYLLNVKSRPLFIVLLVKASAAIGWGLSELLEVEYASLSSMHQLGSVSNTLGWIYAATGLGCIFGPLVVGCALKSSDVKSYWKVITLSFTIACLSYLCLLLSSNIILVLVASFLRACSSSVLWIYSTLIVQLLARHEFFGRVFTAEMCFFTIAKCIGLLMGGLLIDHLSLSVRRTTLVLFLFSVATLCIWVFYYWFSISPTPTTVTLSNNDQKEFATNMEKCSETTPLL